MSFCFSDSRVLSNSLNCSGRTGFVALVGRFGLPGSTASAHNSGLVTKPVTHCPRSLALQLPRVHRIPVDGRPPNDVHIPALLLPLPYLFDLILIARWHLSPQMRLIRGGRLEASDGFFCSFSSSLDLSSLSALLQLCFFITAAVYGPKEVGILLFHLLAYPFGKELLSSAFSS